MALLKYFKKVEHSEEKSVKQSIVASVPTERDEAKKQGLYMKLSMKEKAEIGRYASEHGVTKARRHFKKKQLKDSSICNW